MADNELAVKITADASNFKEGTDQAKESISMLGDLIGVKIPEGVQKMLAQTELIGPALDAAFAPLAVISLVQVIAEAVDQLKKHTEELENENREVLDAADSIGKMGESLRISNLRLEDHIATLQKKPAVNGVAIALAEGASAAQSLIAELQKAINEENRLLTGQEQGFFARLLEGDSGQNDFINKAKDYQLQINQIATKLTLVQKEGHKQETEDLQASLDKQLSLYRTYLTTAISDNNKALKARVDQMRQANHDDIIGARERQMTEDQLARAQEAVNDRNLAGEKALTEQYEKTDQMLRSLMIKVVDCGKRQEEISLHTGLVIAESYAEAQRAANDYFEKALHAHSKIASEIKKEADEQAADEAQAANALAAANAKVAQEAEKTLAVWQKQTQTAEKIDQLTRDVADAQAEHNARLSVALGYETQEQAAQRALAQVEKDKKTALDAINSRLTAQIAIVKELGDATMNGMLGSPQQKAAYQKTVTDYQNLKIQELQLEKKYDAQIEGLQSKLSDSFVVQLRKQMLAWQDVHKEMESMFTSTLNSMNSALENFITTGKFNWSSLATSAINEIVKIGLQWAESQITMMILGKTTGKETAGSNIMASAASGAAAAGASVAAIPVIGWSMVEAVSAATYGVLAAYEAGIAGFALGGVVPATGLALVHQGERILPASMSGTGAGIGGGHTFNLHYHISGLDGADITDIYKRKLRPMMQRDLLKVLKKVGGS